MKELYRKVLIVTVSHKNRTVNLYGYYTVASNEARDRLGFYRYEIALFRFSIYDGRERYKVYNFVYNVFKMFAPEYRRRIKEAAVYLSAPGNRMELSFAASELGLETRRHCQTYERDRRKASFTPLKNRPAQV